MKSKNAFITVKMKKLALDFPLLKFVRSKANEANVYLDWSLIIEITWNLAWK